MNIEQLQELLQRARTAIRHGDIASEIAGLASRLDNLSSNPADEGAANEYQVLLGRIVEATGQPVRNTFSPREIALMKRMKVAEAAGHELLARIKQIAEEPKLLTQNRAQEFRKLSDQLNSIVARSQKLDEVSLELHLDDVVGASGDSADFTAEFAWFVPRAKVDASLSLLKAEVRDLETLLTSAGELVGRPGYRILYLSASDFGFDFATWRETIDLIVNSLTWFVDKYEMISSLKKNLEDWVFSKPLREDMDKELDNLSGDQFLELAEKAVMKALGDKRGSPEAVSRLSRSVSIIARKLHDGYQFDAKYLIEADAVDDGANPAEAENQSSQVDDLIAKIERIEQVLQRLPQLPAPPVAAGAGGHEVEK